MILTIDNPVALTSDGEGLRSTPGSAGQGTDGALFSRILSSQEAISFAAGKAGERLPPVGQERSGGTMLPGGGKELPALPPPIAGSAADPLIQPFLPDSTLEVQGNGELIENIEALISSVPFEQQDISQTTNLDRAGPLLEVSGSGGSAVEHGANLPSLSITSSIAPELAVTNPVTAVEPAAVPPVAPLSASFPAPPIVPSAVQASVPPVRKPLLAAQDVVPMAKSGQVLAGGFGAAGASPAPIAQKPDMSLVTEDVPVEFTQAHKVTDGIPHKSAGANALPGSQSLALGIGQNVNEAGSASGPRAAAVTSLSTPISDPNWNQDFTARIGVLVDKGVSEAKLQLTPAELGRMEIKISTDGDQTKILFTVQNAAAREAIEQAMPRLRDMLGQEGLQLAHSEVADHSEAGDDKRNLNAENRSTDSDFLEEELDEFLPQSVELRADTMVDYYV